MNHTFILLLSLILASQSLWSQTIVRPLDPTRPPGPVRPTEPVKPTDPVRPTPTPVTPTPVTPTPTPVVPTPVVPTPPPKKQLDRNQLELIVRRATSDFVRDILDIVGEAYQVRYNVREGMLRAVSRIGNYEIESVVQNTSEYQNGVVNGRAQGKSAGESAGRQSANNQSYNVAQAEISAAIDRTLDTGATIQFQQNPRMVSFSGSVSNLSAPLSIESRWRENESSKVSQIRRLLRRDAPSEYVSGLFDLSSIYRTHSTQLPSDFRSSRVFRTWFDNDLRMSSSAGTDGRNFYKEITNSNLFEQAIDNGDIFQAVFIRSVDANAGGSIDRQWDRKVSSTHLGALNLGESLYLQEASEYASDRGYYRGYNEVFTDASIASFNRSYLDLYRSNYSVIEQRVRTSAVVSEIQAAVVNEDGKSEVTYGDTFNVILTRIANRGMVDADVVVEIPNQNQVTSFNMKRSTRVKGLTRVSDTQVFQRLAWISAITAPDQSITISADINGTRVSLTAKATYEELIRKAVRHESAEHAVYMMNIALQFMKKQYDDMSGFNDQYANRDPGMLLVRVRKLFDSMNDHEKAQLRAHGQLIRNVFGGKPTRFLNPKRDEWDATQAMINEMALPGTEPKEVN